MASSVPDWVKDVEDRERGEATHRCAIVPSCHTAGDNPHNVSSTRRTPLPQKTARWEVEHFIPRNSDEHKRFAVNRRSHRASAGIARTGAVRSQPCSAVNRGPVPCTRCVDCGGQKKQSPAKRQTTSIPSRVSLRVYLWCVGTHWILICRDDDREYAANLIRLSRAYSANAIRPRRVYQLQSLPLRHLLCRYMYSPMKENLKT